MTGIYIYRVNPQRLRETPLYICIDTFRILLLDTNLKMFKTSYLIEALYVQMKYQTVDDPLALLSNGGYTCKLKLSFNESC